MTAWPRRQGREERDRSRALDRAAWYEWRLAKAMSTGHMVDPEFGRDEREQAPGLSRSRPPRWFSKEELGRGLSEGPSLEWICSQLAKMNARAMEGPEAPRRQTWPRRS